LDRTTGTAGLIQLHRSAASAQDPSQLLSRNSRAFIVSPILMSDAIEKPIEIIQIREELLAWIE